MADVLADVTRQQIVEFEELGRVARECTDRILAQLTPDQQARVRQLVADGWCWMEAIEMVTGAKTN